ncbi:MAG: hypothetical protein R3C60_04120 [Parvularculaceae bacterium]
MTLFVNELAAQQVERSRILLSRRRFSQIAQIVLSYGLVSVIAVACAGLAVGAERTASVLLASGVSGVALLFGICIAQWRIREMNRALDYGLEVFASIRAMALETDASKREQDGLSAQFRDLQDQRSRSLLGRKRILSWASNVSASTNYRVRS